MRVHSVMKHTFSQVPKANIPRSSFNRSCGYKTTFDAGYLIPIFVDEALPGDTFNCHMSAFARLATPITPFMDNLFMDTFFFAVPLRLVWDNFQKFMGEQTNPGDSTDYLVPTMTSPVGGYAIGSISDYFGIPTGVAGLTHTSLYHRCYNLIYNEWFRDQNMQDSLFVDKGDGPDDPTIYVLQRRGKRHDYFTSCLPWPQKGPAVDIPLGTSAPVNAANALNVTGSSDPIGLAWPGTSGVQYSSLSAATTSAGSPLPLQSADSTTSAFTHGDDIYAPNSTSGQPSGYWIPPENVTGLTADLTLATAATINSLRQAFQIQKLYERDARGGTRYTEVIRSHFGVMSPDARLQRPEFLGGGTTPIVVNPVAQTSSTDSTTPQANLAAIGTVTINGHGFTKSFTEHCIIIGLVSVRADLSYQQGLSRIFSRQTRFDYYWPVLSHIGEQAVLNKEIYAQGTSVDNDVFGYQERYAEYRYKPSLITGKFRSSDAQTLDVWHLAQNFTTLPSLNSDFIVENPPVSRVIAVNTEPHFLFDSYFKLRCARPMPVYSVPGLIDHF